MKKIYIRIAAVINLITALIHLIAGQSDLVTPLMESRLTDQSKAEWLGVWHLVTLLLFYTSYIFIRAGFGQKPKFHADQLRSLGTFYVLAGVPFIVTSICYDLLAPQFILLMPIGILLLIGTRKTPNKIENPINIDSNPN